MKFFRAIAAAAVLSLLAVGTHAQTPNAIMPATLAPPSGYYYVAQAPTQAEVIPAPAPVVANPPGVVFAAPHAAYDPYATQLPPGQFPPGAGVPPGMMVMPDGACPPGYPLPGGMDWGCGDCTQYCSDGGWISEFFFAGDAWADKGDDNRANNFGVRLGANFGYGIGTSGLILQGGGSIGGYDLNGRETSTPGTGTNDEVQRQIFITLGLGQRANPLMGTYLTYGIVWDYLNDDNWGEENSSIDLQQLRGRLGFALGERNEVGIWGAYRLKDSTATSNVIGNFTVTPINQANLYWEHRWDRGAQTMAYVGWADSVGDYVLGLRGESPLSEHFALFGNAHYIAPSASAGDGAFPNGNRYSEATWNITFGVVYYPGGKAPCVFGHPLFGVADNGTFALGAPTGDL